MNNVKLWQMNDPNSWSTQSVLIQEIIQELQDIPEEKLAVLYDVIHYFRLGLSRETAQPRNPGLLVGQLSDAFLGPLPEEELRQWE